ncbi:hypothetical protein U4E84_07670 [Halorubrum sp. AD140]|uniref:hypothetical protein n=1 Tax=Halorubrum sp. AD140 TaxID=3050073 RepID=UPI002ACC5C6C|nr:hypothetical protein [Halorubrum sp. AD140]MDZ5811223.1 hypothetical protein [Halorubrum sp. AD140]
MKADGEADLHEIDRFDGGVGWIAYPEETMERASHAVAVPNEETETADVWVFDPVDAPGLDDLLADLGTVAGVVVGLDRHVRDSAAVATRHDVSVWVPDWMTGVAEDVDAPVERFGDRLADTGFEVFRIRDSSLPPWQEVGFFDGETLIVPESLGTSSYFRGRRERLGVHPMLRLFPPTAALSGRDPDRVLVGHGVGVLEDAAIAVEDALSNSRGKAPALYAKTLRDAIGI